MTGEQGTIWDRHEKLLLDHTLLQSELEQITRETKELKAAFYEALDERNQTVEALHKVLNELAVTENEDAGRLARAIEATGIHDAPGLALDFLTGPAPTNAPVGNISATPSLAVSGYTVITWSSEGIEQAEVTVEDAVDVNNERILANGARGSVAIGWIEPPPHLYVFRLYTLDNHQRTLLEAIIVEAPARDGRKAAGAISCQVITVQGSSGEHSSARIAWSTRNVPACLVTVEDSEEGGEQVLSSSISGAQTVEWLQPPPHHYTFRLYDVTTGVKVLLDYAFATL
jgi:hypothetical protein